MPRIVIREIDETTTGGSAANVDVVYIPGFAATNAGVYVYSAIGDNPEALGAPGGISEGIHKVAANGNPGYACNVSDKITWKYTAASKWEQQAEYITPSPENSPTLCKTVSDFEAYFGKDPYTFTENQAYPVMDDPSGSPGFAIQAIPKNSFDYMCAIGSCDKSYIMAKELLRLGLPVLYDNVVVRDESDGASKGLKQAPSVEGFYANISDRLSDLEDKGEYAVKYITSGGYPTFEYNANAIANKLTSTAANRGDCLALIDHTDYAGRSLLTTDPTSVYRVLQDSGITSGEYAAMFTPWGIYSCPNAPAKAQVQTLPASFGYMAALAKSVQTNAGWIAVAGVTRGQVPYLQDLNTVNKLTNPIANEYQPREEGISINAITNIKPYGLVIWGNRTMKRNAGNIVATSLLNTRNLVSDVKKVVYDAARTCMFEQNSEILWVNFKSMVTPTLDQMLSGFGISGYKIIKGTTTEKAKLVATVKLYPTYAVEEFDISIVLSDEEISVS